LAELTERFESIRRETEEVATLLAKEEADNRRQLDELEAEKQERKREQKKKEEQTEKLKREVHSTERTMRNAQQRKTQREKQLREKVDQRSKYHDNIAKWEKSMDDMRREIQGFESQRKDLAHDRDTKLEDFRQVNGDLQQECSRLEVELKEKREQVKELEDARKKLPGGADEEEWRDDDGAFRRECQRKQKELHEAVISENKTSRRLDDQIRILSMQLGHIPGPQPAFPVYNQANSSGVDLEATITTLTQLKRRSRNSNSLSNVSISSPLPLHSQIDPAMTASSGFHGSRTNVPPGFAQGPFMSLSDMPRQMDEEGIRASAAPLSPSATALLPSNILDEVYDDPGSSSRFEPDSFSSFPTSPIDDPHSPASSGPSMSLLSSPQGSTHNLPFPTFTSDHSDGRSQNTGSGPSPTATDPPGNRLSSFFNFQRSRHAKPPDEGPALGSLKHGQSQSFPRQTDEADALTNRRRISLSGTLSRFNRNSAGPDLIEGHATQGFSAKSFNPFSSSHRMSGSSGFADHDPGSSRPGSTASSEFPRPSTDSSSIWGPQATDQATLGKQSRLWSPDATWSRNPSRRPSLHGSPSALKTTLASADDEILDEETLPNAREVGVIGSRLPGSSKSFGRLNPNAPAFIGFFQRGKSEKDSGKEKDKSKGKAKAKDSKDKHRSVETPAAPVSESESPSDSRQSRDTRDTLSVHTQASISESHDSLSLDLSVSNTPSEPASSGLATSLKDENVVKKLFRKGSSSKFSLPGRLGVKDSGLFKKGTGSSANSEKGLSVERSSMGDGEDVRPPVDEHGLALGRSYDSVTSSPSLGPTLSNKTSRDSKSGTRWLSFKKGKKEKESLDLDRERVVESQSEAGDEA
jgi:predicted  nucleic acid-binding Zn-ribbon protein